MNDTEKALAAADAILAQHGEPNGVNSRELLGLAYLTGQRDGMQDTKAIADAALARLADDLRAVAP